MTELNVNHNVYQALHNAVQPAQEPGQRAAIEADEVQAIETAIIADGDVSTDESTLLSSLRLGFGVSVHSGEASLDIDPLSVRFPEPSAFQEPEALQIQAIPHLRGSAVTEAPPEPLTSSQRIADIQTSIDVASAALDSGSPQQAAEVLRGQAAAVRAELTAVSGIERDVLEYMARDLDLRARAYTQIDPANAMAAAGSLQGSARNLSVIAEGIASEQPEYSAMLQQMATDSQYQAELIYQSGANSRAALGMGVSETYRSLVDTSFEVAISDSSQLFNHITGARDRLIEDRARMNEVFDYMNQRMSERGQTFDEVWHDMFNDSTLPPRGQLPRLSTPREAALFLRDHEVTRGLLAPMLDFSEGITDGNDAQTERARAAVVEVLRANDQWDIAEAVLTELSANAATPDGQAEAARLEGNASSEWWRAKTAEFAREDLPVLLLAGLVSGGTGSLAGVGARALGLSATATRAAVVGTEVATFVPAERLLSEAIHGNQSDWSGGAIARDYALTLGGYGLAKALGAGWRALRGSPATGPAAAPVRPGPQTQALDPHHIRFSQNTIKANRTDWETGASLTYDELVTSMRTQGWNGPPVNAVLLPDGQLTSIDNRRLLAAREAGISAQVRVRSFDEVLTPDEVERLTRRGHPPPTTWGEALTLRIRDQSGRFGELTGNSGAYEAPRINP